MTDQPTGKPPSAAADTAARVSARTFVANNLTLDTAALRDAVAAIAGEGHITGLLIAAQQTGGAGLVAGLGETLPMDAAGWTSFWDNWKPGNADAADLIRTGGILTPDIEGIDATTMDRLGTLLADGVARGDSVDTIAKSLGDIVDDPDRAYIIADTEAARAVSAASMDSYIDAGVQQVEWLANPGACDLCLGHAAGNPWLIGDVPTQPAHPICRCSYSPLDPGAAAYDTPEEEGGDG